MSGVLPGYAPPIVEATGCAPEDAAQVEEFMRVQYGTLDHLDRATFNREARVAYEAFRIARAEGWSLP